jgi:hypothetical protein
LGASHLIANKITNLVSYNEIEEIDDDEAKIIQKLTEKKSATIIQKLQLRKYYFDLRINHTLELKDIEFYFWWDIFSYNKAKLHNAYFIRIWSYEINKKTFQREVSGGGKWMCKYRYLYHAHFLTTRTLFYILFNMCSKKWCLFL